jgi:GDP-L-fucose synthase
VRADSYIYLAGHRGLLGSATLSALHHSGFLNVITRDKKDLDLRDSRAVSKFFDSERPEYVFMMAGRVGGIAANNDYPVEFFSDNIQMAVNVINAAATYGVTKLLYTSSSCAYPKYAGEVPIQECQLLTGEMEPTNKPYALAKIGGMALCEAYRRQHGCQFFSTMPTNLYGIGDHYHPTESHVLPGIIQKIHQAFANGEPSVQLWGSGRPIREFLYSADCARAHIILMNEETNFDVTNIGGEPIMLIDLAHRIADVIGYRGTILWNTNHPDGTPERRLESSRILSTGWAPALLLDEALPIVYQDFLSRHQ